MFYHPKFALFAFVTFNFVGGISGCNCTQPPTPAPLASGVAAPTPTGAAATTAPAPAVAQASPSYEAIVNAPDRSVDDRVLDAGRHPVELLQFLAVRRGMKVAEISAGMGYTTELLARAVAPNGVVYGQNSKFILERFAEKPWGERLSKPVMKNVIRVDREFDDPFPTELKDLDLVIDNLFYHDTVWMKTDREKMNRSIFAALHSGGVYIVIDHSGRSGTGTTETQSLHRIEEQVVRDEVQKVGFRLEQEANFLRNPNDTRDWNASPRAAAEKRGTSDRFALKFVKP